MEKMINVKVGGMLLVEKKKCSLSAGARNEEKKKNMTCNTTGGNSNTHSSTSSLSTPDSTVVSAATPRTKCRMISRPSRMKFLKSLSPQLNHFETYTSHFAVITSIRTSSSFFNTTTLASSSSASSSSYPFSLTRRLVTSAPILIPLLLFIATMPVSGLANDELPKSPTLSSYSWPSTDRSIVSSTHHESLHQTETLENHRHHPRSASSTSSLSTHLAESPLSDQPIFPNGKQASGQHTCYVCLPPDKTSRDAEEILSIFPEEIRQRIPDCASFGSQNAKHFEFKCPPEHVGCLLRIHGKNESRSCGKLPLNDCKTANSVELCYCTGALCNGNRPEIVLEETESDERLRSQLEDEKEERETRKIWKKGETDDEDLLGPHHADIDGMQDDTGDIGSGGGSDPPPGVIHQYTSTPKPTLIPNIRPDTKTTATPSSSSGAPGTIVGRFPSAFRIPFTSIIVFQSAYLASLVPLLLQVILLRLWDITSLQLNL